MKLFAVLIPLNIFQLNTKVKHESRAVRSKCLDSLLDLLLKNFNPKKKRPVADRKIIVEYVQRR